MLHLALKLGTLRTSAAFSGSCDRCRFRPFVGSACGAGDRSALLSLPSLRMHIKSVCKVTRGYDAGIVEMRTIIASLHRSLGPAVRSLASPGLGYGLTFIIYPHHHAVDSGCCRMRKSAHIRTAEGNAWRLMRTLRQTSHLLAPPALATASGC